MGEFPAAAQAPSLRISPPSLWNKLARVAPRQRCYLAREAAGLRPDIRILDSTQIRVARAIILVAAAVTGGLHAMERGEVWCGFVLALGTVVYVSATAAMPAIATALERPDSPHHMVLTVTDLLVITGVVWVTGGAQSEFYLLYYLPVVYAALRMNVRDGIGATGLAAALYLLVAVSDDTEEIVVTTTRLRTLGVIVSASIAAVFFALIRRESEAYESLRSHLHDSLRRVAAVYDLAHAANTSASVSAIASILLDQAGLAVRGERGAVALVQEGGRIEVVARLGADSQPDQGTIDCSSPAARQALATRSPVVEEGTGREMRGSRASRLWHLPLVTPSGVIGVLALAVRAARKPSRNQVEFLEVLCAEAATAIENLQLRAQLNLLASTDHLTGLSNRREIERVLATEAERAARYQRPISVLMIDIDNLKDVNDCYGHAVGDQVISALGQVLSTNLRSSDRAGRMGGDEFLVVLPESDATGGQALAERIVTRFGAEVQSIRNWEEMASQVGVSIGIAHSERGAIYARQLVAQADEGLYQAKRQGKNRTCAALRAPAL